MKPFLTIFIAATILTPLVAAQENADNTEANKALVQRFTDAYNNRQWDSVAVLVADNFTRHCEATPDVVVTNRDQFIEYLKADAATFPDARMTGKMLIAEGDLVAGWSVYEGTQEGPIGPFPPSHKTMQLDIATICRIENGKLAEMWVTWDNLAALTQLGHFPPPQHDSE